MPEVEAEIRAQRRSIHHVPTMSLRGRRAEAGVSIPMASPRSDHGDPMVVDSSPPQLPAWTSSGTTMDPGSIPSQMRSSTEMSFFTQAADRNSLPFGGHLFGMHVFFFSSAFFFTDPFQGISILFSMIHSHEILTDVVLVPHTTFDVVA